LKDIHKIYTNLVCLAAPGWITLEEQVSGMIAPPMAVARKTPYVSDTLERIGDAAIKLACRAV
jgi:hypothetical protein